jgi:hypothetical protein
MDLGRVVEIQSFIEFQKNVPRNSDAMVRRLRATDPVRLGNVCRQMVIDVLRRNPFCNDDLSTKIKAVRRAEELEALRDLPRQFNVYKTEGILLYTVMDLCFARPNSLVEYHTGCLAAGALMGESVVATDKRFYREMLYLCCLWFDPTFCETESSWFERDAREFLDGLSSIWAAREREMLQAIVPDAKRRKTVPAPQQRRTRTQPRPGTDRAEARAPWTRTARGRHHDPDIAPILITRFHTRAPPFITASVDKMAREIHTLILALPYMVKHPRMKIHTIMDECYARLKDCDRVIDSRTVYGMYTYLHYFTATHIYACYNDLLTKRRLATTNKRKR